MRSFIFIVFISIFYGCSSKNYYLLEKANIKERINKNRDIIGVDSIELPGYLLQDSIAIGKGNKIVYLDNSYWAVHMDEYLTQRLINTLQKSLRNPNVYNYPWSNTSLKITKRISVKIGRFIADNNKLYLDATWQVFDKNGSLIKSKLFNKDIKLESFSSDEIVKAMNLLFYKLEEQIIDWLSKDQY